MLLTMTDDRPHIRTEVDGGVLTMTIDRPDAGNMFQRRTANELCEALRRLRDDAELSVGVLTGAGERFFCLGGEHTDKVTRLDHAQVLPMVDVYELLDTIPKVVIAAVNGFAVGGGNVLQVVCDLTVAADNAVFRQVGPLVGSFDAGYGTWYLEEVVGRKRAKEMWYLNNKYDAEAALAMGLINEIVPAGAALARAQAIAADLERRGPQALAALKVAFSARHHGVLGQARMAHDLLLTKYLVTDESHAMSESFRSGSEPDTTAFNR
jgi:naphthoate synthase